MIKCFYGNGFVIVTAHTWSHWEMKVFEDNH